MTGFFCKRVKCSEGEMLDNCECRQDLNAAWSENSVLEQASTVAFDPA